jgi:hypothetical protein
MNTTKWNEIFKAFYENECAQDAPLVRWRTKDIENGYISNWDGTWTHFGCKPREWDKIDYLQIELTKDNSDLVFDVLRKIHVPGEEHDGIISIYGYRTDVDYLR